MVASLETALLYVAGVFPSLKGVLVFAAASMMKSWRYLRCSGCLQSKPLGCVYNNVPRGMVKLVLSNPCFCLSPLLCVLVLMAATFAIVLDVVLLCSVELQVCVWTEQNSVSSSDMLTPCNVYS